MARRLLFTCGCFQFHLRKEVHHANEEVCAWLYEHFIHGSQQRRTLCCCKEHNSIVSHLGSGLGLGLELGLY